MKNIVSGGMVLLIALVSGGHIAGEGEAGKDVAQLVRWFGKEYADKPYDLTLRVRVGTFESEMTRQQAFIAELEQIKNDDAYSRDLALLAGLFETDKVLKPLTARLRTADSQLRFSILLSILTHRTRWVVDKDTLLSLLKDGDERVRRLVLMVAVKALGKSGAEIYAQALADRSESIRREAIANARLTGSRIEKAVKNRIRALLAGDDRAVLASDWHVAPPDVMFLLKYLEETYLLGEQGIPEKRVVPFSEYAKRLLDATERIDMAVEETAREYGGGLK